jgi:hypothetical protein
MGDFRLYREETIMFSITLLVTWNAEVTDEGYPGLQLNSELQDKAFGSHTCGSW